MKMMLKKKRWKNEEWDDDHEEGKDQGRLGDAEEWGTMDWEERKGRFRILKHGVVNSYQTHMGFFRKQRKEIENKGAKVGWRKRTITIIITLFSGLHGSKHSRWLTNAIHSPIASSRSRERRMADDNFSANHQLTCQQKHTPSDKFLSS